MNYYGRDYRKKPQPIYTHKYSQAEYVEKRKEISDVLSNIEIKLAEKVTSVKKRILKISLDNMSEIVDYYFNTETLRTLAHKDTEFLKSFKQIHQIPYYLKDPKEQEEVKEWVDGRLRAIKNKFVTQHQYIKMVEEEVHQLKKKKSIEDPSIKVF